MSHIPNAAMKHAGPTHHDEAPPAAPDTPSRGEGLGVGAWIAIGGTLIAGAAAALAVPLLRARKAPVATRRGKRATVRKPKASKASAK
ncbi:hypothetical protein M9979_10175 [Sphingomonas sp. RP10(2022)]|uniref:Uncharacterized protein n=1 Tax=Sphingomonas liriopis TaxID=2949094 RepID=A0A9X2KQQ5_9SPHN|nr:hypothetical protein [Sphingomonas liriopis]MCP3735235.1 hypothetical protein [Sphingomonas liriopis]